MTRITLPLRRRLDTRSIVHRNRTHTFNASYFEDGRVAEVFAHVYYGTGDGAETDARDASIILSLALQHGTPIETIRHALSRDDQGKACSVIGAIVDNLKED